jgi:hypothetical protein
MGMFRQTKEAFQVLRSDELKELKKKADARPRPSMMEGVRMANEAMDQVPAWQQQGADMAALAGSASAYANGEAGNATVDAIADTGMMINNAPVMELDLTVAVPGREPYAVKHRQIVALSAIPNFQPGKSFPVHVDRQDPAKIVIG